jgi:DNA-binding response OmpR family regulator
VIEDEEVIAAAIAARLRAEGYEVSVELDPARRTVVVAGSPVELTRTEFDLLALLAARPGVVYTREQLLAEVWGWRDGSGLRTVDSHVRGLRRKLGAERVRTVHGVGYALTTPPTAEGVG